MEDPHKIANRWYNRTYRKLRRDLAERAIVSQNPIITARVSHWVGMVDNAISMGELPTTGKINEECRDCEECDAYRVICFIDEETVDACRYVRMEKYKSQEVLSQVSEVLRGLG